jgi:capsule polysaccharide export protein KpsE/RkpR
MMLRKETIEREELLNGITVNGVNSGQAILFEQYRLLRRTWIWVLAMATIITAGVAVYYFYFVPVEYRGVVRALPPNKSGTPLDNLLGGVASTLKDFGLSRLVGGRGGDQGYDKMVLLSSRPVLDSLIEKYDLYSVYDLSRDHVDDVRARLAANLEVQTEEQGPIVVSVFDTDPERAAHMANDVINFTNSLALEVNRRETVPISEYVGERLDAARKRQLELESKMRTFMAHNRVFDPEGQGAVAAEALSTAEANVGAQRALVAALTQALGADDPRTLQARELLTQYEAQSRRLAAGRGGALQGLGLEDVPDVTVQYLRLKLDYETNAKVIALMEPMYEQTEFDELRNIPILNIFEPAIIPQKKARPRRSLIIVSTFVGSLVISYLLIAFAAYLRNFRRRYRYYVSGDEGALQSEVSIVEEYHDVSR